MGENHEPPVHSCTEETAIPLFIPHPPTTHLPCSVITLNMYTNKKRSTLATNKILLESVFVLQMENKP